MGMTYTLANSTLGLTSIFLDMGMVAGRYAFDIDRGAPIQDIKRFRQPGVKGQYVLRGGSAGRRITLTVRYIGDSVQAVETLYETDVNQWSQCQAELTYGTIVDKGLNLQTESVRKLTPIRSTGNGASCYCDVLLPFTQDNIEGEA
jgi:hypothetical protein